MAFKTRFVAFLSDCSVLKVQDYFVLAVDCFIPGLKPGWVWFSSLWYCVLNFLVSGEKILLGKHKIFLSCKQKW